MKLQVGRCVYVQLACLTVDAIAGCFQNPVGRSRHETTFELCCGELASRRGAKCRMEAESARVMMVGVMYKEVVEVQIEVL